MKGGSYEEEDLVQEVKESDVVDLLLSTLESAYATKAVNEYVTTGLMKLTTRISDSAQIERIRRVMMSRTDSLDVEIQQRSVEYGNLFGYDSIRRGVLEKMPPPEIKPEEKLLTDKSAGLSKGTKAKKVPAAKAAGDDVSVSTFHYGLLLLFLFLPPLVTKGFRFLHICRILDRITMN